MESRYSYEDLYLLEQTISKKESFFTIIPKVLKCTTFSEDKFKHSLKMLSLKTNAEGIKENASLHNQFMRVTPLAAQHSVNEKRRKEAEVTYQMLFEYDLEDLPLMINDITDYEDFKSLRRVLFNWRMKVGK